MATSIGVLRGTIELDDKFSSTLSLAGSNLQKAGRNFTAVGSKMSAAGSSITRSIGLPLALASGAALKLSSDFETSLTKIQTLVGLSAKDVQGFRADILSLSGETAQAPKELADAMFFVTSAGLRGSEALDTLKFAAQAAAIGLGSTVSVADAVTSAMNAYGPSTLSAERATNILALAVRAGKLEASELAPVLGRLLPTASAMGIAFEDVAGVLAVMSKTGLDAAEASTSLSAIMTTLLKPTKMGADALASVGLELSDLRSVAQGPGGIIEAMRMLDTAFQGNDEALVKVVPNVRAFRGVMNVLAQDAGSVDAVMKAVASDVDVLGSGMKIVEETTGFKFNQFMTKLKTTGIELGDTLAPAFEKILEVGVGLLEWAAKGIELFGKLPGPIQTTALAMVGLGIAMGPVMFVGGNMITMFGSLLGVMGGGLGKLGLFSKATGAIGTAGVSAGKGLGPLAKTILPNFMTKTVQGRNALGHFTKGVTKFDASFLKTSVTLTSVKGAFGALGTGIKTAALSLSGVFMSAVSMAGTALSALWVIILANPIGALAIAIGIVAVAVSSFVFKEGGMFENWMAGTKETLGELQTGITSLTGSVATLGLSIADNMRDTFPEVTAAISAGVAAGKDMNTIIQELFSTFAVGTEVGDALRATMIDVSAEMNAGARAASELKAEQEELAAAKEKSAAAAEALRIKDEELKEMLSGLGVVTREDAIAGINELTDALNSGLVPPDQMAKLIDELEKAYKDLGLLGIPEVEIALDRLNDKYSDANGILKTNLDRSQRLGLGLKALHDDFVDTTEVADNFVVALPKAGPPFQSLIGSMKEFGIVTIDADKQLDKLTRLMESGQAPVRQMVEAIRAQRDELEKAGQLTPEVVKKLNDLERAALKNATAADRAAIGFKGLFDGLVTGIPSVDTFLGKFGGIFDAITGVLGGLGGKIGGFFSGITDQIGSLFGAGGQQGGANFFSGITGALGGLGGLFGSKGEESGTEFSTQVAAPLTTVPATFQAAGTAAAQGFGFSIQDTLGGGGGFSIGDMFNTAGTEGSGGFLETLGIGLGSGGPGGGVPGLMSEAGATGGGGFLSGLAGIFGGGGGEGGGGLLGSIFSGAGGGAGGNFLSGLMGGLTSGMGAAKSGIQGIFQAGLSLIPVVGPILSQFAGPLFKGIMAIGGKIKGFFSGIFGGVSAEEKQAREFANSLNDVFRGMLDTAQLAEVSAASAGSANDQWAVSNIAVRDAYLAVGMSAAEAAAATTRLSESARGTPAEAEAAAAAIKVVTDEVQNAMSVTGLSLLELRNKATNDAKKMGISVAAAFDNLVTATTSAVTDATGVQCEAQTAAATCGVNSAEQVATAVEASSTKQVTDVTQAQAEIVAVTEQSAAKQVEGVTKAQTDIVAVTEEAAAKQVESVAKAQTDIMAVTSSTGIAIAKTVETTTGVVAELWTGATTTTEDKLKALKIQADIQFQAMADKAAMSTEEMALNLTTGLEPVEGVLMSISSKGAEAFSSIAGAAREAVDEAIGRFRGMERELVGASIIPDMVDASNAELLTIGHAAAVSAGMVTGAFGKSSDTIRTSMKNAGQGGRTVFTGPDTFPRSVRRGGEGPGGGAGGGSDMVVQVVMPNGQVLAETVVKEMPRVLGNKGLRRI